MFAIARKKGMSLVLLIACLLALLYFVLYVSGTAHVVVFSEPTIIYPRS